MEGVDAASRMDKIKQENGAVTFKHIWTRAKTRESKSGSWHEKTKLDIVRPGRYIHVKYAYVINLASIYYYDYYRLVDIRMASILDRPCCSETENAVFRQTAEKIAESMKV